MPVSWLLRRILLDNLLLPLLLCSILFAVYLKKSRAIAYVDNAVNNINKEKFLLILFSGIFLGLAIFTKFPAFTFIPLVGCLIFTNNNKSWKILGLWFIPVIGIPLLWPAYAISIGDLDGWWKGFFWQAAGRIERPLWMALDILFKIDPVLIVLGTVGILFAAVKKDFFPLLWVAPFLVLLQVLGYVSYWFFIPILPAVAVGSGRLIEEVLLFVYNQRKRKILIISIISSIYIFGFVSTMMLITTNLNSTYYQVVASIIQHLHPIGSKGSEDKTTLIGNRWVPGFSWIPDFVFPTDLDYKKFYTNVSHIGTDNILLVVDKGFVKSLEEQEISEELKLAYDNTSTTEIIKDDTGNFDLSQYPYTSMRENRPIGKIEIRTNLPR
jgi:hypothetical protein